MTSTHTQPMTTPDQHDINRRNLADRAYQRSTWTHIDPYTRTQLRYLYRVARLVRPPWEARYVTGTAARFAVMALHNRPRT
jgi:hypothetical protein